MRKLLSIKYSAGSFNAAMLVLRLALGILMMHAGYFKLVHFNEVLHGMPGLPPCKPASPPFMNFLGIGSAMSLALVVFAEFFCSLFLILGLFTRLAAIPLIITMCVALFKAHNAEIFGQGQTAALYLTGYLVLLFVGPGKASVDSMIAK